MTVSLKHTFQSTKDDSPDTTIVQPSNWNEEHALTLATNKVLGRATAGTGAAEELSVGTALSVSGGTLAVTTVPASNGGTGVATLPANNVLIGNGTSAVTGVAPGTSGNVLVSDGTSWTSSNNLATPLAVVGNATAGAEIRLPEDTDNGANYVAFKAPNSLASNLTLTLPSVDGTNGQVLQTNGSGTLSFATVAGPIVPISTTTISGSPSSVTFSGLPAYQIYVVDFTGLAVNGTSSDILRLRFFTNGVERTGVSDYFWNFIKINTAGSTTNNNAIADSTDISDIAGVGSYSTTTLSGRIIIYGGAQSALPVSFDMRTVLAFGGGNNTSSNAVTGYFRNTETQTLTGVKFFLPSATFNRGTIKIYGLT